MSRIGKKPILIPEKVEVKINGKDIAVFKIIQSPKKDG